MKTAKQELMEVLENHKSFNSIDESLKELIYTQFEKLSEIDPLTNTVNRTQLQRYISTEWSRSIRYHSPISLIMFGIDGMSEINKKYGHDLGDELLQNVATTVYENIRVTDIIGRWEYNIFLVIVPTTNNEQATWLAGKLKDIIENTTYMTVGKLSCSFGVAEREAAMDVDDWINIAEEALNVAKIAEKGSIVDYESIG